MSKPIRAFALLLNIAAGGVLGLLLTFGAAPASALQTHLPALPPTFNAADAPEAAVHPLAGALGLAVDNSGTASDATVYVSDPIDNVLDRFNAKGEYLSQLDGSNTLQGSFSTPYGVAVDQSSADLYVADYSHGAVDKFDSSSAVVKAFGTEGQISAADIPAGKLGSAGEGGPFAPTGVAVNPAGHDLFVADNNNAVIDVFSSSGAFQRQFASNGGALLLAIDSAGNLFVANGAQTDVYVAATGALNSAYGSGSGQLDAGGSLGVAVDPTSDEVYVADNDHIAQYDAAGKLISSFGQGGLSGAFGIGFGVAATHIYAANSGAADVAVFGPLVILPDPTTGAAAGLSATGANLGGSVDPAGGGEVISCSFEYGTDESYGQNSPCDGSAPFAGPVSAPLTGLAANTTYHYRLDAANAGGTNHGADQTFTTFGAPQVDATSVANLAAASATLQAQVNPDGISTEYHFEYGLTSTYGTSVPIPDAALGSGQSDLLATHDISGLQPATTYHFRIVASNAQGAIDGPDETFTTLIAAPALAASATDIHTDGATLRAQINPNGAATSYHFEYGLDETYGTTAPVPDASLSSGHIPQSVSLALTGLSPDTVYHYRVIAENEVGPQQSADRTFITFANAPDQADACPNALARQQTGASQLRHCRAYELVSAANTGGYDVESDLVPGQEPYGTPPEAEGRVIYGIHSGGIPGTNHPTNRGVDPYVATRGEGGWSTEYVGVPADNPFSLAPFSSPPSGTDSGLETFAFAGPDGCSPCFAGGYTGIPVRLPSGELVQGMVASPDVPPPGPGAKPDGYVAKELSANGEHLIFGSTSRFASGGNDASGDASIYDRNLRTGETRVVSDSPAQEPLPCLQGVGQCHSPGDGNGIAELDISKDGSRILVGQKVTTDTDGNVYWHLYLYFANPGHSVDLTPGTSSGVLYDGMTADGSRVFFTSADGLLSADTDASADIYEAEAPSAGSVALHLVTPTNSDSCAPVSSSNGPHWNTTGALANCSAVAVGGGGGVAAEDGAVYFLSPEQLDGASGIAGQPNLYLAQPGSQPHFITTLEPNDPAVLNAVSAPATRETGDFQATPSGGDAVFASRLPLTGDDGIGYLQLYRYDRSTDHLDCVSCNLSGAQPTGSAALASDGLSLTADGRVFFTTGDPLVLRDSNAKRDVYEWENGTVQLISTGTSPFDSGLLSADSGGADVYFFTRDSLVQQDQNGPTMKIYDARSGGGAFIVPSPAPCAASDECHGPGTPTPGPPSINTVAGTVGNFVPATKSCKVHKRHGTTGKCAKGPRHKHHHGRPANTGRGGPK